MFPAHDENELLEYITVTIGRIPKQMLESCKKYKLFYKKTNNFLSTYSHELIRSKDSNLGKYITEGSQPIGSLLYSRTTNQDIINFIEQCLVLEPEKRLKP